MIIAVDVREALATKPQGKGFWVRGFVEELLSRDVQLLLYTDTPVPTDWQKPNVEVVQFSPGILWHWKTAQSLRTRKPTTYISTVSFIVPWLLGRKQPFSLVIHDLIAFRNEPHNAKASFIERLLLPKVIHKASHIFTVSDHTAKDVLARFCCLQDIPVTPIYAGPSNENPSKNTSDNNTILCVGTLCPRKNQFGLIRAFSDLPEDLQKEYKLLLVGSRGWCDDDIVELVKKTPNVEWLNYVSDEEYEQLLSACHIFAYPSLYEGFGLQILDALQRGIPVLTSKSSSLAEVADGAAVFVEPHVHCSILDGLEHMLRDDDLLRNLREKGPKQAQNFSWKHTVDKVLNQLSKPSKAE